MSRLDRDESGYRTQDPTPIARLNRDALMVCPVCAHVLGGYDGTCDYCGTLIDAPLEVEDDDFDENDAALIELCRRADAAGALRYAGVCPHAWTQPAAGANDPARRDAVLRPVEDMPPFSAPVPADMVRCLECGSHVPVAPGANPMLESTEVTIMEHEEIETPGYYVVAADRPGRDRRQLDVVQLVDVKQVRTRPGPGSHEARFVRSGVVERAEGTIPVEQVLRRISDPREIETLTAARSLAATWADGYTMSAERWKRLGTAMETLWERGGVAEPIEHVYGVTLAPADARAEGERSRARLAAIESGREPSTPGVLLARLALRAAELRVQRRATGRRAEACEIASGFVQAQRRDGDGSHDDAWAEAAARAEQLSDEPLRLDLPDGSLLAVDLLTAHDVLVAWSDLPGAPYAHLAYYICAFEFMHGSDALEAPAGDAGNDPSADSPAGS